MRLSCLLQHACKSAHLLEVKLTSKVQRTKWLTVEDCVLQLCCDSSQHIQSGSLKHKSIALMLRTFVAAVVEEELRRSSPRFVMRLFLHEGQRVSLCCRHLKCSS